MGKRFREPTLRELDDPNNPFHKPSLETQANCPHGGMTNQCACGIHYFPDEHLPDMFPRILHDVHCVTIGTPSGLILDDYDYENWPTAKRAERYTIRGILCPRQDVKGIKSRYPVPVFPWTGTCNTIGQWTDAELLNLELFRDAVEEQDRKEP
ncbi:hypothetical protein [Tsukamurella tyrosinosolvens]|uniref:hypothetical protein n=1 Tax=Tsukamurella tyrosinosolvens TaxID=57704 RepID=UPI001146158B|nr:hypothetical protein [Tsukamurella tyrosinosolvens]